MRSDYLSALDEHQTQSTKFYEADCILRFGFFVFGAEK